MHKSFATVNSLHKFLSRKCTRLLQPNQTLPNATFSRNFHTSQSNYLRKRISRPSSSSQEQIVSTAWERSVNENVESLLANSVDPTVEDHPGVGESNKQQILWEQGPYPRESSFVQSQAKFSYRPSTNPEMTSIVLFPGQGSQYIGMAQDLLDIPSVQDMFEAANEILGFNLLKACLEGPAEVLTKTEVQQAAVFVTSLAAIEKVRMSNPSWLENCVGTAGFSVGEITALTFAGSITFEDALSLIKVRSEAMQLCSELSAGGMMTVISGADARLKLCCLTAKEYCKMLGVQNPECCITAHLNAGTKVVGGSEEALAFLVENKKEFRLRRLKRLDVSGAFHSSHMQPAQPILQEALKKINIKAPEVPVHSNVDGKPYRAPHMISKNLVKHLTTPVRWEQTLHILYEREHGVAFPRTYGVGPGNSMGTLLKMVNAKAHDNLISVGC